MNIMYNDRLQKLQDELYHRHVINLYKKGIVPLKNSLSIYKSYIDKYNYYDLKNNINSELSSAPFIYNPVYYEHERKSGGILESSISELKKIEVCKSRMYGMMIDFKLEDCKAFKHIRMKHFVTTTGMGSRSWIEEILPKGDLKIRIGKGEGNGLPFFGHVGEGHLCTFNLETYDSYEKSIWVLNRNTFGRSRMEILLFYNGDKFTFGVFNN
jgi:hypothetical protein